MEDCSEVYSNTSLVSKKLQSLAITTPIVQGETLLGYMERLAFENVYFSVKWISQLIAEGARPYGLEWFEALSQLTNVSSDELLAALKREHGPLWNMYSESGLTPDQIFERMRSSGDIKRHLRKASNRSFCPRCLGEAPYERSPWLSRCSLYCLTHECLLVHQCPTCRSAVHVTALIADCCLKCGTRLSKAPISAFDPTKIGSQVLLDHWWGSPGDILTAIPNLPETSYVDLYRVFFGVVKVSSRTRPYAKKQDQFQGSSSTQNGHDEWQRHSLAESLAIAYESICNWPAGFFSFLDSVRRRRGRNFGKQVPQDFGPLYVDYLEIEWVDIPLVQRAFEDFLHKHYQYCRSLERTRRYQENQDFRSRFKYISYLEAASRLGIHSDEVQKLASYEVFIHEFPHKVPYGRGEWLNAQTVDYLGRAFVKPKSVAVCAIYLGVPEDVVSEFARRGLLATVNSNSDERLIEGRSMMDLLFRYRSVMSSFEGPMVSMLDAAKDLKSIDWNLADIVVAILNGQVRAMGGGVAITNSFVCGTDLEKLKFKLLEPLLEQAAATTAQTFGVHPSRVLNWYVLGMLPKKPTGDGNPFEMTQDDVDSFREKYVRYREAAQIVGLPESTFADYASKGRFKEVSFQNTRFRSGLFLKSEVERFAPGRTLSPSEIKRNYGIHARQLEKLVQSRLLTRLTGPGVDRCNTHRYAREDIVRCIAESKTNQLPD